MLEDFSGLGAGVKNDAGDAWHCDVAGRGSGGVYGGGASGGGGGVDWVLRVVIEGHRGGDEILCAEVRVGDGGGCMEKGRGRGRSRCTPDAAICDVMVAHDTPPNRPISAMLLTQQLLNSGNIVPRTFALQNFGCELLQNWDGKIPIVSTNLL